MNKNILYYTFSCVFRFTASQLQAENPESEFTWKLLSAKITGTELSTVLKKT